MRQGLGLSRRFDAIGAASGKYPATRRELAEACQQSGPRHSLAFPGQDKDPVRSRDPHLLSPCGNLPKMCKVAGEFPGGRFHV